MSCCGTRNGAASCGSKTTNGEGTKKDDTTRESVAEYYGKILQKSSDLKTNACTTGAGMPPRLREVFPLLADEVVEKYYGCGVCVPEALEGCSVLDLGCGAGRDCYLISKLVGSAGRVVGIDMTPEQLEVANKYVDFHTTAFGFETPNVEFRRGFIERLGEAGLEDDSFDVIVSNCVINLSPDKESVLREAFRVLKPGGELYFSDVYADRRVPEELVKDPVLFGECLSGALYWNDFLSQAKKAGFADPRLVEDSRITVANRAIQEVVGHINFFSATYRLFKLPGLEPACEDYGQAVIYKGTLVSSPKSFVLDAGHELPAGKVVAVCGNSLSMLVDTRFAPHFEVVGSALFHYGIFAGCGGGIPFASAKESALGAAGVKKSGGSGSGCC